MAVDTIYDVINKALFLLWGGQRRLRRALVDAADVRAGQRVLELGCGTGLVTELLVDTGAEVVGVDSMPEMLVGARRRAPGATLIEGDAVTADVGEGYDRVILSFVLHNFDRDGRVGLLRRAAAAVNDDGRIGVLEWAQPPGRLRAALWRRFLAALEPSPTVPEILDGALDTEIRSAGLRAEQRRSMTGRRTQILVLE